LADIDKEKWFQEQWNDRRHPNGNKLRTFRTYKNSLDTSVHM